MADNALSLEDAVVFIWSHRKEKDHGFKEEHQQLAEALNEKWVMGEPFSDQEYRDAYKMLDCDYYKNQLKEGGRDFGVVPEQPPHASSTSKKNCRDDSMSLDEVRAKLHSDCIAYDKKTLTTPVKILRPKVVHILIDNLHILTSVKADQKKAILYYWNGRYEPDGELIIEKLLAHAFTDVMCGTKPLWSTHEKREVLERIRELTPALDSNFDADLDIINMTNGLYNWRTGEFKPHTPDYPSRIQIPIKYDPNARCPTIEKLFEIVIKPMDIPKVIEFIGYCLYRKYPIQKVFILLGPGGTGKSFLIDVIQSFVGEENSFSISPQELTTDRFAAADLYRKLLNAMPDVGDAKLAQTALLKALTGRSDKVRGQRKFQDPFEFINFAKMLFGFNSLPETADKTSGFYRRIEIIRMEHVLGDKELSKEFIDKITSPEELSGLFNLAIKTLPDLLKRNTFTNETSRDDMAEQYEQISNPMKYFCEHFLKNVPDERISKDQLFSNYKEFCKAAGVPVPKKAGEQSAKNHLGRFIHNNVDWLLKATRDPKDEVGRIGTEGSKGKTEAIWPDTEFDRQRFDEWVKSKNP